MKRLDERWWQGNREGATVRSLGAFMVKDVVWAGDPGCSGGGYDTPIKGARAGLWTCEAHGNADLLAYIGPRPNVWELFDRGVGVDAGMISLGSESGMCKTYTAGGDGCFPIWLARDPTGQYIVGVKIQTDWEADSDEERYFEEERKRLEAEWAKEDEELAEAPKPPAPTPAETPKAS